MLQFQLKKNNHVHSHTTREMYIVQPALSFVLVNDMV